MEKLQNLPNITRLSEYVIRVLGQNPGKFTLQGTNTYLIGRRLPFILIDTGEGRDSYPALLEEAFTATGERPKRGQYISDIIITHQHYDHYGGIPDVLRLLRKLHDEDTQLSTSSKIAYTPPRIHRFPSSLPPTSAEGDAAHTVDHHERYHTMLASLKSFPPHSFLPPPPIEQQGGSDSAPDRLVHELREGTRLETQDGSASLEVIHTPGHTVDSICLLLRPQPTTVISSPGSFFTDQPEPSKTADTNALDDSSPVLFTADTVLGQGTAVFEDLHTYIFSLQKLLSLARGRSILTSGENSELSNFGKIYPGHGPVIANGTAAIATYIEHRLAREAQIVDVLRSRRHSSEPPASPEENSDTSTEDGDGSSSIWEIVSVIYASYPQSLWLPAAHGVGLHLLKLEKDGRARRLGGEGVEQRWALVGE